MKPTIEYLRAALEAIEEGRCIEAMRKIAHDALNGEWEEG